MQFYELDSNSGWEDRGTGTCQGDFHEDTEEARLIGRAQGDTNEILFDCVIHGEDVYQRTQDTLIVWTEPDGRDLALSFADPRGCDEVWDFITEVQRHLRSKGAFSSHTLRVHRVYI